MNGAQSVIWPTVTPPMGYGNKSPESVTASCEVSLNLELPGTPRQLSHWQRLAESYRQIAHMARDALVTTCRCIDFERWRLDNRCEPEQVEAAEFLLGELAAEAQRLALDVKQCNDEAAYYNALLVDAIRERNRP